MTSTTVHLSGMAGAPRAMRSRLRITARGRAVLAVVVAAPLVALALWFGLNSGTAGAAGESTTPAVAVQHITVTQGQSLWQIAEKLAPRDDPRDVISAIVDYNGLRSSVVTPGQTIAVPPQFTR